MRNAQPDDFSAVEGDATPVSTALVEREDGLTLDVRRHFATQFLKSLASLRRSQDIYGAEAIAGKNVVMDERTRRLRSEGVLLRAPERYQYELLREIVRRSTLHGTIQQIYADDARLHGEPNAKLGFQLTTRDPERKVNEKEHARLEERAWMIARMGDKSARDWRERDSLGDVLEMAVRDVLTLDKVVFLVQRTRGGEVRDVRYLDPATIYRVDPQTGYRGMRDVAYAQVVDGMVVEVFEAGEIVMRHRTRISDIKYRFEGWSPLETCLNETLAALFAMKTNLDRANDRNPPRLLITIEKELGQRGRELFEEIWERSYSPGGSMHRIPLIDGAGGFQIHNLDQNPDMLFQNLYEWVVTFVFATYAMDPSEAGIHLRFQSNTLSEPSIEGRARMSRNRRHTSIMRFLERILREIWSDEEAAENKPTLFTFSGTRSEDAAAKLDQDIQALANFRSLDQILAERDLPSYGEMIDEYPDDVLPPEMKLKLKRIGAMIANQHFANAFGAATQDEAGGGEEDSEFDDYGFPGGGGESAAETDPESGGEPEPEPDDDEEEAEEAA